MAVLLLCFSHRKLCVPEVLYEDVVEVEERGGPCIMTSVRSRSNVRPPEELLGEKVNTMHYNIS